MSKESHAMLDQLLKLDASSRVSLQLQLKQRIAEAIMRGHLAQNLPLPSSRKLSSKLKVARNTVVLAYQQLQDDGYLVARERRGYFVNPEILRGRADPRQDANVEKPRSARVPDWSNTIKTRQAQRPNIEKPENWQRFRYPFVYGQFDTDIFPTNHWRECCKDSVSRGGIKDWASDHFINDDPMLLDEIRTRILPRRGIWADNDQIMITVGTQQGLYILIKMLLGPNGVLGVENPGYTDIRNIAALNDSTVRPLAVDKGGLVVDETLRDCDCLFVTPSHQSPTTVTLPLDRRQSLLKMAAKHDFMIIEDDYECETSFTAAHTPALKSLDEDERVIYAGSFSKILAPGLRLGYIVASREIIREAVALRRLMVRHPPANNQRSVALFIARGYYDALAAKLLKEYEPRWQAMADALATHLPNSSSPPTFGGSSYWVAGPDHLDARALHREALNNSLIIEPGDIHFFDQTPPSNYFRLGYSSIKSDQIEPGIKLLAKLIDQIS